MFVRPLVFEDTLIGDFKSIPRAEDINNGINNGMRWRQKPDGNYKVTRLEGGRVIVANFDPMALTDRQRFELNEKIKKNPAGFVYLDIRPDGPGGNFPIHGAIKLRSMFMMLKFIAEGIYAAPEFDVGPTTSTGGMESGPAATLRIRVTNDRPANGLPYVFYKGHYYSTDDTSWDRTVFRLLNRLLFQTTVGKVEKCRNSDYDRSLGCDLKFPDIRSLLEQKNAMCRGEILGCAGSARPARLDQARQKRMGKIALSGAGRLTVCFWPFSDLA